MANGQHWRHRKSQIDVALLVFSRTLNLAAGEEGMSMLSGDDCGLGQHCEMGFREKLDNFKM